MTARKFGRTYVPTEAAEQRKLLDWCRLHEHRWPCLALLYHVPNGTNKHITYARDQKRQGLKAGVPDLCLPVPRGVHHGLYIELKRIKGGKVSPQQAWWHQQLRTQGYRCVVALGWEAAREEIEAYLVLPKPGAA